MQDAHDKWVQHLVGRGLKVRTFICMANANSSRYTIEGKATHGSVMLCTTDELRTMLATHVHPHAHNMWMNMVSEQKL